MKILSRFILSLILFMILVISVDILRFTPQIRFNNLNSYAVVMGTTDANIKTLLQTSDAVVIRFGIGGEVEKMIDTIYYLRRTPEKIVVIDGPCYSACTMLLGAPHNVLISERAEFFFHSSYVAKCTEKRVIAKQQSRTGNRAMWVLFNEPQRKWIETSGAFKSLEFTKMDNKIVRNLYRANLVSTTNLPTPRFDFRMFVMPKFNGMIPCEPTLLTPR